MLSTHGNFYDYSKVVYVSYFVHVEIICPKHGSFWQAPSGHIGGKGCEECAKISRPKVKQENASKLFVKKAMIVPEHQGKGYTYESAEYLGVRTKLTVTCPIHKGFDITPNNHLNGKGCPLCAEYGYRRNRPGYLYVLQCMDITKVGITNNPVKHRQQQLSLGYGEHFAKLKEWHFEDGKTPCTVETVLLSYLRSKYLGPISDFPGSTECFIDVDIQDLLITVEQLIKEYSDTL